jgi:hypothetical protein
MSYKRSKIEWIFRKSYWASMSRKRSPPEMKI